MTRQTLSLRVRSLFVSFMLLSLLILASCGINATSGQSGTSGQTPVGIGKTPEPGTIEKPVLSPDGYFESLLVANGLTYIGSDNGNVYAMQASSGKMQWHYDTGNQVSLFAMMNGNIYAQGGANGDTIYALNAQTGALVWQHRVDSRIFGDVANNGFIYVNTNGSSGQGGSVYSLDGTTGAQVWRYTRQVDIPQPLIVADGVVYFIPSNRNDVQQTALTALRASDGQLLWQFALSEPPTQTPIASNGVVYVANGNAIDALTASSGTVLWHSAGLTDTSTVVSFTVADTMMYAMATTTDVYAIRLSDGRTLWRQNTPITFDGTPGDAPVVENGVVYLGRNDGNVYALRASNGAILWHQNRDRSVFPPFIVANNTIYVNTQSNALYALRVSDGSLLWQARISSYSTWSPMYHSVVVANDRVYAGTTDGIVKAFDSSDGKLLWQYKIKEKAVLPDPVYSAEITFKSSVSYAQALRLVTNLGLLPERSCRGAVNEWQPMNLKADFSGYLLVGSTTASAPLWLDRLKANPDVKQVQGNPVFFGCRSYRVEQPTKPGYLPTEKSGSYASVTFSSGTSYDTALNTIITLGFRLANPCYEMQRAQGKKPVWTTIGQESAFATSHTLLVATTRGNATNWQQQIQATTGVVKVETSSAQQC